MTNALRAFATAVLLVLIGCVSVSREADLVGEYLWVTPMAKLVLKVNENHSYSEGVFWTNGKSEQVEGAWALKDERIVFEGMIIPSGALPTFPSTLPRSALPRSTTARLRCAFSPERHYGGPVMLVADPDSDLGFKRSR